MNDVIILDVGAGRAPAFSSLLKVDDEPAVGGGDMWPAIIRNCTFSEMKAHGAELVSLMNVFLKGGPDTFFNKGTDEGGARC
jgi:hypothetical protein